MPSLRRVIHAEVLRLWSSPGARIGVLSVVPRRVRVLTATSLLAAAVGVLVTVAGSGVVLVVLGVRGPGVSGIEIDLGAGALWAGVAGACAYSAALAVLGVAAGWLTRSSSSAVLSMMGLLFLLPVVGLMAPAQVGEALASLLPSTAGRSLVTVDPAASVGQRLAGLAVVAAWPLVAQLAARWRASGRDL